LQKKGNKVVQKLHKTQHCLKSESFTSLNEQTAGRSQHFSEWLYYCELPFFQHSTLCTSIFFLSPSLSPA